MYVYLFLQCRNSNYAPIADMSDTLMPARIVLPLSLQPLQNLLQAAKECLLNNFYSCLAAVAGSILLFHYESIMDLIQKECPLILLYSRGCGTGMTIVLCIRVYIYIYIYLLTTFSANNQCLLLAYP